MRTAASRYLAGIASNDGIRASSGHQLGGDAGEIVQRAHALHPVAVARVERHLAVAEAPGVPLLGAEPDQAPALALHLRQYPRVRRVVVGAPVSDDDYRRPPRDRAQPGVAEELERGPVVGGGEIG